MKAIIAVARTMLTCAYHMLSDKQAYRDLGEMYLENRDRERIVRNLTRRIRKLGYEVELRAAA